MISNPAPSFPSANYATTIASRFVPNTTSRSTKMAKSSSSENATPPTASGISPSHQKSTSKANASKFYKHPSAFRKRCHPIYSIYLLLKEVTYLLSLNSFVGSRSTNTRRPRCCPQESPRRVQRPTHPQTGATIDRREKNYGQRRQDSLRHH
jgi:hypothetical protein